MDFSRYEKLRTLVRANFSEQTRALVDEALEYADGKLAGLVRYDGSPLLEHAAAVASIVISEVGLGRNSTISAILHDVVRLAHKQLPAEEFLALSADIRKRFGDQVVGITLGLANISELKLKVAKEQADNFRDLIVSYSEDPRVILIKLADRLEVMRSLEMFPREKWRKKGQAYSKMAAGPKQGRLPASHKTWSPIQPAQDSTPWPEPFVTLDDVKTHYVVGLGENKGAVPKKKP